jgi:hypothetical protein
VIIGLVTKAAHTSLDDDGGSDCISGFNFFLVKLFCTSGDNSKESLTPVSRIGLDLG